MKTEFELDRDSFATVARSAGLDTDPDHLDTLYRYVRNIRQIVRSLDRIEIDPEQSPRARCELDLPVPEESRDVG